MPIPKEDILWEEKKERICFVVSSGEIVGIVDSFIILAFLSNIAHNIFVPPASITPKSKFSFIFYL